MRSIRRFAYALLTLAAFAGVTAVAVAAGSPSVTTAGSSNLTESSAKLAGTVNPNGTGTTAHFEWGLTTSYGVSGSNILAGFGTKSVAVSFTAGNLLPGTVYHYRLDASNRFGETFGADRTLKTAGNPPPDAATGPATTVTQSTVELTGVINPHGAATSWAFQYGLGTTYGVQTFGGTVPAGSSSVTVSEQLQGLQPGTSFHYRIVAYHGSAAVTGADGTFVTLPAPRPSPTISASTHPSSLGHAPFHFATVGNVQGPPQFPPSDNCSGRVTVEALLGTRVLAASNVRLGADCSYSTLLTVRKVPGLTRRRRHARVRIVAAFAGNDYLAPAISRTQSFRVG